MGILLEQSNPADIHAFNQTRDEVQFIIETSKKIASESNLDLFGSFQVNSQINGIGYCIRTGVKIAFNPSKPFAYEAYKSWEIYRNPDYQENFCHFSGEPSNGETTYAKPIMNKNWKRAKDMYGL
jgi:hypothetical protein